MNAPAQTEAPPRARRSPYQGIVPYTEADAEWFFGRDESREIVIDNLSAYRVSVLYGESGVGKSSVLRAAVLPHLRAEAVRNVASSGAPEAVAVVFADWSVGDPLAALKEAVRIAVAELSPELAEDPPTGPLVDVVTAWCERVRGVLLVVLDQFEEFFLYHSGDAAGRAFEEELSATVRSREAAANVLIAIREDALAKLDRLQERVPGLLDNLLRLEHLDLDAAREAIELPLEHWNTQASEAVTIEPALVEEVLDQVEAGKLLAAGTGGAGRVQATDSEARVEAPFLQLVLVRIWDEEQALGSRLMRLETLVRLGGAERIVRTHLDQVLETLTRQQRSVAAKAFRFLVTPSGTKIALQPNDLAAYARVRPERLVPVLAALAGEPRILRPVSGGAYEIYHDVLTAPMLDWRRRYDERESRGLYAQRMLLLAAAGVVGLMIYGYLSHALNRFGELHSVDTRFAVRGSSGTPKDVVVVAIDAKTFNDLRIQWPFPRRYHAKVIGRIAASHPKAIAIDIEFVQPSTFANDNALITSVAKARHVVLAASSVDERGNADVLGGNLPAGVDAGSSLFEPDSDGVIRRVPYSTSGLTAFGLATAAVAEGKRVPRPRLGSARIDFAGPPGTVETYSYSDVYFGRVPPSAFRNKIVVIGTSAPSLQDLHATSASGAEPMSGAEIQANVIEAALHGFPLQPRRPLDVTLIVLFGLLVPLASLRLGSRGCLLVAVAAGGLYLIALQVAFDHGVLLPALYPLLALVLTTAIVLRRQLLRRSRTY